LDQSTLKNLRSCPAQAPDELALIALATWRETPSTSSAFAQTKPFSSSGEKGFWITADFKVRSSPMICRTTATTPTCVATEEPQRTSS